MERRLKQFRPAVMRALRGRYGEAEVTRRWEKIEELCHRWLREDGDLGGRANAMADNMTLCYAVCAFYEAMDRQLTRAEFDRLVEEVMRAPFRMMGVIDMNRLYKKRRLMGLVHACIARYARRAEKYRGNAWGNTWKLAANPEGREVGFAMTLYSCPLCEFARKRGYMDILPWMCDTDHRVAAAMHAKLIRHKTLAAGDGCCEYWYVGDRSPEALADAGSK